MGTTICVHTSKYNGIIANTLGSLPESGEEPRHSEKCFGTRDPLYPRMEQQQQQEHLSEVSCVDAARMGGKLKLLPGTAATADAVCVLCVCLRCTHAFHVASYVTIRQASFRQRRLYAARATPALGTQARRLARTYTDRLEGGRRAGEGGGGGGGRQRLFRKPHE